MTQASVTDDIYELKNEIYRMRGALSRAEVLLKNSVGDGCPHSLGFKWWLDEFGGIAALGLATQEILSRRIEAALSTQPKAEGWRPIDTAPKDASEIILGIAGENGCSFTGYWEDQPNYWGEIGFHDECWRQGGFYSEHPSSPTHWMPLPPAPTSNLTAIIGEGD